MMKYNIGDLVRVGIYAGQIIYERFDPDSLRGGCHYREETFPIIGRNSLTREYCLLIPERLPAQPKIRSFFIEQFDDGRWSLEFSWRADAPVVPKEYLHKRGWIVKQSAILDFD